MNNNNSTTRPSETVIMEQLLCTSPTTVSKQKMQLQHPSHRHKHFFPQQILLSHSIGGTVYYSKVISDWSLTPSSGSNPMHTTVMKSGKKLYEKMKKLGLIACLNDDLPNDLSVNFEKYLGDILDEKTADH